MIDTTKPTPGSDQTDSAGEWIRIPGLPEPVPITTQTDQSEDSSQAGEDGGSEAADEKRDPGEKPGPARVQGGLPCSDKTTQRWEESTREDRPTEPETNGEETRSPNEGQAIGGSSTPLEVAENPASDATDGDSGHGGSVSLDSDDAPEEAADNAPEEESDAYLQTDLVGTTAQRRLLEKWTEGCLYPEAAIGFLLHAWAMFRQRGAEPFPVYCRTMREQLPDCPWKTAKVWKLLDERGVLLVRSDYSYSRGRCREFQLAPWAAQELAEAGRKGAPRAKKLLTGERHYGEAPVRSMRVSQENNNAWSWDPITESLKALKGARHVVNYDAAEEALEKLEEAAEDAEKHYVAQPSEETEKALEEAQSRYASADACLQVIDDQTVEELDGGLRLIKNAYEVQTVSGRLTFKGGGPQSLPRAIKAALYDLPGIYNWDIKGSQTWALRQLSRELQELGLEIDTSPLDDYLARGGKDAVVREHGLPRKLAGRAEHSVKFGAFIPKSLEQAEELIERWKKGSGCKETLDVVEHVREFYSTEEEIDRALATLYEVFEDMMEMIRAMAEALITVYWEAHRQKGGRGMGHFMRNACEITFNPFQYEEGHRRRSKAMAWYLQGLEAAFVHAITALSTEYDYEVLANEHDGLITRGRISKEAIKRARELSGFHRAEFIRKPLADQDELDELDVCLTHRNNTTTDDAPTPSGASETAEESTSTASTPKESSSGARNVRPSLPPNRRRGASTKTRTSSPGTSPTPDTSTRRPGATTTSGTSTRTRATEPS